MTRQEAVHEAAIHSRGAAVSARAPWWLEGGTETCGFCSHAYAYHVERRCYDCDRPFCPFCVTLVAVSARVVCPECADADAAETETTGGGALPADGRGGRRAGRGAGGRPSSPRGED